MQTEATTADIETLRKTKCLRLRDGSVTEDDFFRLNYINETISFARLHDRADYCERRLLETEEMKDWDRAFSFCSEGIFLDWVNPKQKLNLTMSPCADTVHLGPVRESLLIARESFLQKNVPNSLAKILDYQMPIEILCNMRVRGIKKRNGLVLVEVGIN